MSSNSSFSGRGGRNAPVTNIVTHIVRNYSSNGKIRLPNTTGGRAFKKALREKGIRA